MISLSHWGLFEIDDDTFWQMVSRMCSEVGQRMASLS